MLCGEVGLLSLSLLSKELEVCNSEIDPRLAWLECDGRCWCDLMGDCEALSVEEAFA
jgi:hypothetical protein